jgi:6-phosphogluconolactonase
MSAMKFQQTKSCRQIVFAVVYGWLLASCGGGNSPSGPAMVAVPNIVGMTQAAATTAITGAGLTLGTVTMANSATVASGNVISESPAAAANVASGSAVNLTVSSGPAMVTVPDVVGMTQAAATTAITGAGLTLGTVTMASSATVASGNVISESPAAAASVASGSAVNLTVSGGPAARFAYVPNAVGGTISAYAIDSASGALTPLASSPITVAGSVQLYEAKIDPSGKFLYVVDDSTPGKVYAFLIDQSTGSLTAVTGSPFAAGNVSESLAFDATGSFLYVSNNGSNDISAYSLDPSTGAPTPLAGSPYSVSGANPAPSQIVSAGNYLYVTESGRASVDVFSIGAGTGALTEGVAGSPFATHAGSAPYAITVDPSGTVAYVATPFGGGSLLSAFTINATTGVLSPAAVGSSNPEISNYLGIDTKGKFLFVTQGSGVLVYPIDSSTGALGALVAGSPFATGGNAYSVSVDPTGRFVYVCNDGSANISEFTLNRTTGVLTPAVGSPFAAGTSPDFIAIE